MQSFRPQLQTLPVFRTGICPISPAVPSAPFQIFPFITTPQPMPVPRVTQITQRLLRMGGFRNSAHAAARVSCARNGLIPISSSKKAATGSSCQPILGAHTAILPVASIVPGIPMPTESRCAAPPAISAAFCAARQIISRQGLFSPVAIFSFRRIRPASSTAATTALVPPMSMPILMAGTSPFQFQTAYQCAADAFRPHSPYLETHLQSVLPLLRRSRALPWKPY